MNTTKVLLGAPVKMKTSVTTDDDREYRALCQTFVNSYHTLEPDQMTRICERMAELREVIKAKSPLYAG